MRKNGVSRKVEPGLLHLPMTLNFVTSWGKAALGGILMLICGAPLGWSFVKIRRAAREAFCATWNLGTNSAFALGSWKTLIELAGRRTFQMRLLVTSLQKFFTMFLLCLFEALDKKRTTGLIAHTIYAFMCRRFFVSPCRIRLSAGPGQGMSYPVDPLGIPQQIGDL
jgi:hypothetical protein